MLQLLPFAAMIVGGLVIYKALVYEFVPFSARVKPTINFSFGDDQSVFQEGYHSVNRQEPIAYSHVNGQVQHVSINGALFECSHDALQDPPKYSSLQVGSHVQE
jgi:hypothetical protein